MSPFLMEYSPLVHKQSPNGTGNAQQQHQGKQHFQSQQQDQLQLGHMVDTSFLLQDFQFAQSVAVGVNGQVGAVPFLGFDLQQQLNSLATTAQPSAVSQQMDATATNCTSSCFPSFPPTSVSLVFSSPSAVPCTSTSSNCFPNACPPPTDLLLNGYPHQQHHNHHQQLHPMRFLSSATKMAQEKDSPVEFVNDRQHIGYDLFCTTANRGTTAESEKFEVQQNGAQFATTYGGQHHFTAVDQFGQLGIEQQRFTNLSAGQLLEGKQIKAEDQQVPAGSTVAMSY